MTKCLNVSEEYCFGDREEDGSDSFIVFYIIIKKRRKKSVIPCLVIILTSSMVDRKQDLVMSLISLLIWRWLCHNWEPIVPQDVLETPSPQIY